MFAVNLATSTWKPFCQQQHFYGFPFSDAFLSFLSESGLFSFRIIFVQSVFDCFSRPFSTNFPFKIFRLKIYRKIGRTFFKSVRFKSFMISIIPSQYSISMLCCRKPYVENYAFHSFLLGNVGEARESKNISSHKFFSIDFPWSRL